MSEQRAKQTRVHWPERNVFLPSLSAQERGQEDLPKGLHITTAGLRLGMYFWRKCPQSSWPFSPLFLYPFSEKKNWMILLKKSHSSSLISSYVLLEHLLEEEQDETQGTALCRTCEGLNPQARLRDLLPCSRRLTQFAHFVMWSRKGSARRHTWISAIYVLVILPTSIHVLWMSARWPPDGATREVRRGQNFLHGAGGRTVPSSVFSGVNTCHLSGAS